jgi:hypothetical protein
LPDAQATAIASLPHRVLASIRARQGVPGTQEKKRGGDRVDRQRAPEVVRTRHVFLLRRGPRGLSI